MNTNNGQQKTSPPQDEAEIMEILKNNRNFAGVIKHILNPFMLGLVCLRGGQNPKTTVRVLKGYFDLGPNGFLNLGGSLAC